MIILCGGDGTLMTIRSCAAWKRRLLFGKIKCVSNFLHDTIKQ